MARRNQPPDRLPPQIRDHSEVVRACREWNVGRLFRVINNLTEEPSKFTVTHLGRVCGLTTSRVVEYMKDTHRVTAVAIIERIADGLHIPGERFGLVHRPWENEVAANVPILHPTGSDSVAPVRDSLAEPRSIGVGGSGGSGLLGLLGALGGHPFLTPDVGTAELFRRFRETDFDELTRVILLWVQQANPNLSRRAVLLKLGIALSLATAAPIFDTGDPDEHQRAERALRNPSRLDHATLDYTEEILLCCRKQGDALGPQIALQTALAQQQAIGAVLSEAPTALRLRTLSIYAEITQCIGWLLFNLGDYRRAQHYYEDARTAAHDAENVDLVTYILCAMSHLATWEGKPRVGIDHAVPANSWAQQVRSPFALSYAADVAARAYAADNQYDKCLAALEQEQSAVASLRHGEAASSWWYFYDESFYLATKTECLLRLGHADKAGEAAEQALRRVSPTNLHNYALTLSLQGEAHIQQGNAREAAQLIGDVAQLTNTSHSTRIVQRIGQLRSALTPWKHSKEVKELDERLKLYGLAPPLSDSTNNS